MKRFFFNILGLSVILNALLIPEPVYFIVHGDRDLEWQAEGDGLFKSDNWSAAIEYCTNLELGVSSDNTEWRLPNYNELYSLVDVSKNSSMVTLLFLSDTNQTYWTSTSSADGISERAWTIDFSTGKDGIVEKTDNHSIRCVRDLRYYEEA